MSTELVQKTFEESKVQSRQIKDIVKLKGDASTRSYFRISTIDESYIACLCDNKAFNSFVLMQKIFKAGNIPVPSILDAKQDLGYLLQEDLGNITLWDYLKDRDEKEELRVYKEVLDYLGRIQKIKDAPLKVKFDREALFGEMEVSRIYLVEKYLKYNLKEDELKIFGDSFLSLCQEVASEKMVLTHRDFHSRNIMYQKGPVFIDFQDARLGIAQYDLASLLEDCYLEITPNNVEKLKKYYFEKILKGDDFDSFNRLYDLISVQRLFKAVGTFAKINFEKGDPGYLKYIDRSYQKLLDVLARYPEYKKLQQLLYKIKYEN